jgi:hypothetical protein
MTDATKKKKSSIDGGGQNRVRRINFASQGLSKEGYVKRYTQVLQSKLPKCIDFQKHPFSYSIPYNATRALKEQHISRLEQHISRLASIEDKITSLLPSSYFITHHYGANEGVNLGLSIAPEGMYRNIIHSARFVKNEPDLRKRLYALIRDMMQETYGNTGWYKRLLFLCRRLNEDTGEEPTQGGMPISAIWLTCLSQKTKR